MFYKVVAVVVFAELQLAETECLSNGLNAGANKSLYFPGRREFRRRDEEVEVTGESRTVVEKDESGSAN